MANANAWCAGSEHQQFVPSVTVTTRAGGRASKTRQNKPSQHDDVLTNKAYGEKRGRCEDGAGPRRYEEDGNCSWTTDSAARVAHLGPGRTYIKRVRRTKRHHLQRQQYQTSTLPPAMPPIQRPIMRPYNHWGFSTLLRCSSSDPLGPRS